MYTFRSPATIQYGWGVFKEAGATIRSIPIRRALVVTDEGMVRLGVVSRLTSALQADGIAASLFDGVQPDPTLENVEAGLALLRQNQCDGLIAIGGGSSIDCAKAISIRATNAEPLAEFMGVEKIPKPGLPVVAIPTTAGTGSEATRVMVITDTVRDVKMMIASRHGVCTAAIVDPQLTISMPPSLTAAVGVDAMTHAIEAYVSRRAQPMTDLLAESAIRLIGHNLRTAFRDGSHEGARSAVMLGSMQAGMAFSNSSVALIHGMARPLGACFHLTHGISIAILLPIVTEFSLPAAVDRYAHIGYFLGESDLVGGLRRLNHDVQIPTFKKLGIDRQQFESLLPKMAADAIASGSPANNPRPANVNEIISLYQQAYDSEW